MSKPRNFALAFIAASAFLGLSASPSGAAEVAFEPDHRLPLLHLNVAIRAGAAVDPQGKAGLTNFMGEMLMRGTRLRNKSQMDLALDQMGATLQVETRSEAMIIRGSVLASQLEPFLGLLQEIITQPSFPESELKKLRSEIVSGLLDELGHDPTLSTRRFNEFLFDGHPYGKPILGKTKDIEGLTRADVTEHFERLIHDRMFVIVGSGAAPMERIQAWAAVLAKSRPEVAGMAPIELVPPPRDGDTRRLQIIDKPARTQTQINFGQVGVRMDDPRFFPLFLANYAFGGGSFSARLMVEIRVKRGWSYGANSYFRHALRPRSWQVHLFPAAKDAAAALKYALQMTDDLRNHGITAEEFAFAKGSLVNSAGFMYNTPKKRVENRLLERTLNLPDGLLNSYGTAIARVTHEQVNRALSEFLRPERLAISVLGTAQELRTSLAEAGAVAPEQVEVISYQAQ